MTTTTTIASMNSAQGANPRHEEIRPASYGDELRQLLELLRRPSVARQGEAANARAISRRDAIAEQRIALVCQAGEFGAHEPCALHELELTSDVGIEAPELQAARRLARGSRLERLFDR